MSGAGWPGRYFGARLLGPERTAFRVWAPCAEAIGLEIEGLHAVEMTPDGEGCFVGEAPCGAGARYRYRVTPDLAVPDPASTRQEGDVHGASIVTDTHAYLWNCRDWRGRPWHEAVIYELHVGLLGGFSGVTAILGRLAQLGVTAIELMPVGEFPGARNWGYDGVLPYAPDAAYGTPEELMRLIDTAHGLGLMVFLDVVYNHFGPDGNYLGAYAPEFHRHDRHTGWGDAIDFRQAAVRRYFLDNALYWLMEFRFDGLRLDAVHAIGDADFIRELAHKARAAAGPDRHIHLVVENERNEADLLRDHALAEGVDAQWADDFHHAVHVLLTGEKESYYGDFAKAPAAHLARCLAEGFAYQGEPSPHADGAARGTPSAHLPPTAFVICLQNHDQIGNRALGERLGHLAAAEAVRAATVLLLLTPQIPLLFMGQEWQASAPFLFFTSHEEALAEAVRQGRRQEFAGFAGFTHPAAREKIPDPNDLATFLASVPDAAEGLLEPHAGWLDFTRRLLTVRRDEIMPRLAACRSLGARPIGASGVLARWRMGDGAILTHAVNLGTVPLATALPPGRVLFACGGAGEADLLPPYSAMVTLQGGGDGR